MSSKKIFLGGDERNPIVVKAPACSRARLLHLTFCAEKRLNDTADTAQRFRVIIRLPREVHE